MGTPSQGEGVSTGRLLLRAAVFVLIASFLIGSPLYMQVLREGKGSPYLHGWRLYSSHGAGICDVTYQRALEGGRTEPLRKHELFEVASWRDLPLSLMRVKRGGGRVDRDGVAVCRQARKRYGPDVRVTQTARCSAPRGWVPLYEDKVVCEAGSR